MIANNVVEEKEVLANILRTLKVKHFLQLSRPWHVNSMRLSKHKMTALHTAVFPRLRPSGELWRDLQTFDIDWEVLEKRVLIPQLTSTDGDLRNRVFLPVHVCFNSEVFVMRSCKSLVLKFDIF